MYKDVPIFIRKEATSAMDTESERYDLYSYLQLILES